MRNRFDPADKPLKSSDIDPWAVEAKDFPAYGTDGEKLRFLLNYAMLAPSSHNAQPWLWQEDEGALRLYADPRRGLKAADKE